MGFQARLVSHDMHSEQSYPVFPEIYLEYYALMAGVVCYC